MLRFLRSLLVVSTVFAQDRPSLTAPERGDEPKHQESVRSKPKTLEEGHGKEGIPSRVKKPSSSKRGKAACEALSVAEGRRDVYVDVVKELGREKNEMEWRCDTSKGDSGGKCLEQLQSLRRMFRRDSRVLDFLNGNVRKFKALCPEEFSREGEVLREFEKSAAENCKESGDSKRCENALFHLADLSYQDGQRKILAARERRERGPSMGEYDRRELSTPVAPFYAKTLAVHLEYLKRLPSGSRRDVVLYRTAFIYDLTGRSPDAFPWLMEISRSYPNSRHLPAVHLRIGEYYFADKQYDSAIAYYSKVDSMMPGKESIQDLTLFHKAEAFYGKADFQGAVDAFFEYIERSDKGLARGRSREEAIRYMGSCFARLPGSYKEAKGFFAHKGRRPYEDSLFYELAVYHADRNQYDQAVAALEDFLETFPDCNKAPFAQIRLIEVLDKKRDFRGGQAARERLVRKFGSDSPWWEKSRKIGKEELERIKARIRDIESELAKRPNEAGQESQDSSMNGEAAKPGAAGNPSVLRLEDGRKMPEYTPAFRRADRSRPQVSGAIAPSTCTRYGGGGGEICDEDHTPVWM